MPEATLAISRPEDILAVFGPRDVNLRRLRKLFDVRITQRGGQVTIIGDAEPVDAARRTLQRLQKLSRQTGEISPHDVTDAAIAEGADDGGGGVGGGGVMTAGRITPSDASENGSTNGRSRASDNGERADIAIGHAGRTIKPRTPGQAVYVDAIRDHDLTFATGPAGCGKTYLAVAMAVEALKANDIRKIVLVRPAVEAGENLGYLPGDLQAKLNPYLRPLLDALGEMVDFDAARDLMEKGTIEVIPLAYMRGRTLNDAFIILDEAQNTTVAQMKMFLTRMGQRSKMVVSGDATQLDLPRGVTSGLRDAMRRLGSIDAIGFVKLGAKDIVRHRLVQRIVDAYESTQRDAE